MSGPNGLVVGSTRKIDSQMSTYGFRSFFNCPFAVVQYDPTILRHRLEVLIDLRSVFYQDFVPWPVSFLDARSKSLPVRHEKNSIADRVLKKSLIMICKHEGHAYVINNHINPTFGINFSHLDNGKPSPLKLVETLLGPALIGCGQTGDHHSTQVVYGDKKALWILLGHSFAYCAFPGTWGTGY